MTTYRLLTSAIEEVAKNGQDRPLEDVVIVDSGEVCTASASSDLRWLTIYNNPSWKFPRMRRENRYLSTLSSKLLCPFCKVESYQYNRSSVSPQEGTGLDVPKIATPPAKETSESPAEKTNPEVEAALDSSVEVTSGFSFGSLLFGFVFMAGCAALFVKFNGLQKISQAFGIGKYRYRRTGDMDLEQ